VRRVVGPRDASGLGRQLMPTQGHAASGLSARPRLTGQAQQLATRDGLARAWGHRLDARRELDDEAVRVFREALLVKRPERLPPDPMNSG
jgi:hypothetical protein